MGLTCYNSGGRPAISLSRGIIWVAQACVRRLDIDKKTANWKKTLVGNVKKTAARKLTMVAMGRAGRTIVGSDDQITRDRIVKIGSRVRSCGQQPVPEVSCFPNQQASLSEPSQPNSHKETPFLINSPALPYITWRRRRPIEKPL